MARQLFQDSATANTLNGLMAHMIYAAFGKAHLEIERCDVAERRSRRAFVT
jgi:hypothetical protein